jgi:hypothetical protein
VTPASALALAADTDLTTERNRQIALACAAESLAKVEDPNAWDAARLVTRAQKFEDWLNAAERPADITARRIALAVASYHAANLTATDPGWVLTTAKSLHRYLSGRQ